jgi:ribonuclease PH
VQADGGTRTAAVNAAWIALHDAVQWAQAEGMIDTDPILDRVTAISVGIVDGLSLLDLDYQDDVAASVDLKSWFSYPVSVIPASGRRAPRGRPGPGRSTRLP